MNFFTERGCCSPLSPAFVNTCLYLCAYMCLRIQWMYCDLYLTTFFFFFTSNVNMSHIPCWNFLRIWSPFKGQKKSKHTINKHNQRTLHGKVNNRPVMLVSAQVIPVELREQSDLPMFVSMTLPVAAATKLLWRQFAVCLQFLFSAGFFPPFFFSSVFVQHFNFRKKEMGG